MPKVRSPRGTRTRFSPARVQSTISQAYAAAHGKDISKWRQQIMQHSQRVVVFLGSRHGSEENSEWTRADIAFAIEQEIRKNASTDVHEAYLDLHPERRPRTLAWSSFEAKAEDEKEDNPLWSVQRPSTLNAPQPQGQEGVMAELGQPARLTGRGTGATASTQKPPKPVARPCFRSDWMEFWNSLTRQARQAFDAQAWETSISKASNAHLVKSPEEWWWFWQDVIEGALLKDPRCIEMWRIVHQRHERARLCGQDWLDGSGLPGYEHTRFIIEDDASGRAVYRRLWQEHIKWWLQQPEAHPDFKGYDIGRLAMALDPDSDGLLTWSSWQWMATCEGLWPIQTRIWKHIDAMPHQEAREAPQWAMMRLAMALAIPEKGDRTEKAIEFYRLFSSLKLVPSDAMLREAGKCNPRFCEDSALLVRDKFEAVQQGIHLAATETKWNGTISIDWAEVRSQGAPVGGRRISQGVPGFLRPIDLAQQALGRSGDDRPVSVSLPIWHRDIEQFLSMRQEEAARLQIVVHITDIFMERVRSGASWWLLDPSDFPELSSGGDQAYEAAMVRVEENPAQYALTARNITALALWRRLVRAMERGAPFITYTGALSAALPYPVPTRTLSGIDGVGAFPVRVDLPGLPRVQWPSIAVNLSTTVTEEGDPDLVEMRRAAEGALRLLDNALLQCEPQLSENARHYRPVCLGAVGYYEAIAQAVQHHTGDKSLLDSWVKVLGEGWAAVVSAADQALVKERGAAPCYAANPRATVFAPHLYAQRLAEKRGGSRGVQWVGSGRHDWHATYSSVSETGQRFAVRSVWAPFEGAARMGGVTPGGLGTLRPFHVVVDERRQTRLVPSALLLQLINADPEAYKEIGKALRFPDKPGRWPRVLRDLAYPDLNEWNRRLVHASLLSPWVDQGVSLTLPPGLPTNDLEHIVHKAWVLGVGNIRFEALDSEPGLEDDSSSKDVE